MRGVKVLSFCFTVLMVVTTAQAQTTDARLVGTVTDSTGGVLPGVAVQAKNLGTNTVRSAFTSERGDYVITNLPIGQYEVSAEMPGFKRYLRGPVQLSVEQTARVDVKMEVGELDQTIEVKADVSLIETDRSSLGKVIEQQTIVDLPLNGRNFVDLTVLLPGASKSDRGAGLTTDGGRTEDNNFMLDGVDNNEMIGGKVAITPSIDAVAEFKVQVANYSAEYGRAAGAVVNVALKSGSNTFHGTLFEFVRNDIFDAADFFTNFYGEEKAPLRRNQFGFSFGGPVIKGKTFFFANYEGFRERRASTSNSVVPTAQMKAGDFSGLATLYDPMNVDSKGNRIAFPNNQIPAERLHSVSQKLLDLWPLPNSTVDPNRYVFNFSNEVNRDQYHIRGDHHLTSVDDLMARYSSTGEDNVRPSIALNGSPTEVDSRGGVISWTRTFSPKLINEFRFGANSWAQLNQHDYPSSPYGEQLGLPSFPISEYLDGWHPKIGVRNITGIAGAMPMHRRENTFQWIDQFTLIHGRHTIKSGVDVIRYQTNNYQPQFVAGEYTFNGVFTAQKGKTYANGFGDFLLGLPQTQRILNPTYSDSVRLRNTRLSVYMQDDFNVHSNLTLNLGLRWERDGSFTDKNDRWGYFDRAAAEIVYPSASNIPFDLPYPHRFQEDRTMTDPTNRAFAPRIGLAWRPFGGTNTVIRTGYGIFWGAQQGLMLINSILNLPPFALISQFTSGSTSPELEFGVFPGMSPEQFVPKTPSGIFTIDPYDLTDPYIQQWNLGIEHQLSQDVAIKSSYVGSKGTHLIRRFQGNPALPAGPGSIASRRWFPAFGDIQWQEASASSSYHGLQLQAEKRMGQGLWFLTGYTWSKMIDDSSSWGGISGTSQFAQDPTRLYLEKSRSGHDLRHRFSGAFNYALPVHFGQAIAQSVLGGWECSGIVSLETGAPLTFTSNTALSNAATLTLRADVTGDPALDPSQRTIDRWFNTDVVVNPAAYTFGNSGRNIIDGPGVRAFDFSMRKVFQIHEEHRLQFRAEFFNFFNHPNFGAPNRTVGNVAFGTIRGGGGGREVQLALKYTF